MNELARAGLAENVGGPGVANERWRLTVDGAQMVTTRRAQTMCAAEGVLAREGYAGMSVARVCAEARMSRRTFRDLFADREACFLALFEEAAEEARTVAIAGYEGEPGPWSEKVRGGVRAFLGLLDERPALRRVLIVDSPTAGERVSQARARALDEITVALARSAPRRLPDAIAECVISGAFGVLHMRLVAEPRGATGVLASWLTRAIVLPFAGEANAWRSTEPGERVTVTQHLALGTDAGQEAS
jgi:AcrR family transcriptional regulator